jgi:hypothetical protein
MPSRRHSSACCAHREVRPARYGSSPRPSIACGLPAECPSRSARPMASDFRISVSSPLLDGSDEPKILRSSTANSVSQVLIPDSAMLQTKLLKTSAVAIQTSHSGFRAIQKIATIQVSSGFIRGIPVQSLSGGTMWRDVLYKLKWRA